MTTQPTIPQRGTKDFTKYAISVMMAYDRGEEIESASYKSSEWHVNEKPHWDWTCSDYRIKPKPTVIMWTMETCPVGKVVTHTPSGYRSVIVAADKSYAVLGQIGEQSYGKLLTLFTMDDGSPCGTVQQ